jgi:protein-disulfide isomerase
MLKVMNKYQNLFDQWWFRLIVVIVVIIGLGLLFRSIQSLTRASAVSLLKPTQFTAQRIVDPRLSRIASTTATWGNPEAKIVIIEFGDFQCPYCQSEFSIIREVMQQYQDKIFFIWRHFPIIDAHSEALEAAEASVCAQIQGKFWPFHDKLFANQVDLSSTSLLAYAEQVGLNTKTFINCMAGHQQRTVVAADWQLGLDNGVRGTPTFFINGTPFSGALPKDFWDKAIALLSKGGFI